MSKDTEDARFDETLENLQLLADMSFDSAKASTVASPGANPFRVETVQQNEAVLKEIFGARCECGAERGSSSSPSKANPPAGHKHGASSFEHGIINPTPFKHKIKGEKRSLVRESVLKNIGKCVHQNLLKQNSIAKELVKKQRFSNTFLPIQPQLKSSLSENNLAKGFNNDASDDMLDFRLLVDQCSELTLSTAAPGGKPAESSNFSHSSFKVLRQHDFATFNNPSRVSTTTSTMSRKLQRARQLKRCNSTSSLESDSSSNSGMLGTPPQNPPQQPNPHQSPSTSSPSSSASCSTQARLNSTAMPCDITIDEMASYFETLVHIPKKMSSMAEMMYI